MQTALTKTSEKRDIRSLLKSESVKQQIALALPKHLTPDRMMRVALTAVNRNPKLLGCTPESLLSGLMLCSQVGLEPDGRNAHLIPYGDLCQVIFDWKGLVALARRNGVNATAKLVCENDVFEVQEDDGSGKSSVNHRIDYTQDRGEIFAVYSRAVIDGVVDYEIMTRAEVEYIRQTYSRAKDADAWKKSWGEMAKKTVIRRHSKRWPLDPDAAAAFEDEPIVEAAPTVTKPIFATPPALPEIATELPEAEPEQVKPVPKEEEDEIPFDAPAEEEPKAKKTEAQYLTGVQNLMKLSKVSEADLLEFLRTTGRIEESLSSLQEVYLWEPKTIESLYGSWSNIAKEIKRLKGQGK